MCIVTEVYLGKLVNAGYDTDLDELSLGDQHTLNALKLIGGQIGEMWEDIQAMYFIYTNRQQTKLRKVLYIASADMMNAPDPAASKFKRWKKSTAYVSRWFMLAALSRGVGYGDWIVKGPSARNEARLADKHHLVTMLNDEVKAQIDSTNMEDLLRARAEAGFGNPPGL